MASCDGDCKSSFGKFLTAYLVKSRKFARCFCIFYNLLGRRNVNLAFEIEIEFGKIRYWDQSNIFDQRTLNKIFNRDK